MGITKMANARRRMFKNICNSPIFYYSTSSQASTSSQIYDGMSVELTPGTAPSTESVPVYFFATCQTANATLTWTITTYNRQNTQVNTYNGTTALNSTRKTSFGPSGGVTIPNDNGYVVITGTCVTSSSVESKPTTVTMYNSQENTRLIVYIDGNSSDYSHTYDNSYGSVKIYTNYPDACNIYYTYTQSAYGSTSAPSQSPSDPTISSEIVTGGFLAFDRGTKIKVKAIPTQPGFAESEVVMGTFTVTYPTIIPLGISLSSGTYYDSYQSCTITNNNPFGQIKYDMEYPDTEWSEGETLPSSTTSVNIAIKNECTLHAYHLYITEVQQDVNGVTHIGCLEYPLIAQECSNSWSRNYKVLFRPQVLSSRIVSETGDSAMIECKIIYPKVQYVGFDEHEVNLKLKLEKGEYGFYTDTTQDPYVYQMNDTYTYTNIGNEITNYGNISPDLNQSISSLYSAETSSSPAKYLSMIRVRIPKLSVNTHYRITPQLKAMYSRNGTLYDSVPTANSVTPIHFDTLPAHRGKYAIHPIHNNASSNSIAVRNMSYYGGWSLSDVMHTIIVNLAPINVSYCGSNYNSSYPGNHIEASDWGFSNIVSKNGTNESYNYSFLTEPWSFIGDVNVSDKNLLDCISKTGDRRYANNSVSTNTRDLFGWGTSYNDNALGSNISSLPWMTSQDDSNYYAYGEANADLRNVRSRAVQYTPAEPNTLAYDASNYENARIFADWASVRTSGNVNSNSDGEYMLTASSISPSFAPWYNHWPSKLYQGSQISKSNCDISAYNGLTKFRSTQGSYSSNPSSTDWDTRTKMATLSEDEWKYILGLSSTSRKSDYSSSSPYSGTERMCYAKGRIHLNAGGRPTDQGSRDYYGDGREYINGLFIFSDQFQTLSNKPFTFTNINTTNGTYAVNTVSANEWYGYDTSSGGVTIHVSGLENWITFLPAAGYRSGTDRYESNEQGYYWTRTHGSTSSSAKCLHFSESIVEVINVPKSRGCSVRLGKFEYYTNRSSSLVSVSLKVIEKTPQYIKLQCKVLNDGGFNISGIGVQGWTTGYYKKTDTSDGVDYYTWKYTGPRDAVSFQMCDSDGFCTFNNLDGCSSESGVRAYKWILYITKTGTSDPTEIGASEDQYLEVSPLVGRPVYDTLSETSFNDNETDTTTSYAVGTFNTTITKDMGFNITERGICRSGVNNPDFDELVLTANGSGKGTFSTDVLFPKQPFSYEQYIYTYAKNYNSGGWGNEYYWHDYNYYAHGRPFGWSKSSDYTGNRLHIVVPALYPWIKSNTVTNQNMDYYGAYVTCEFDISSEVVLNAPSLNSHYPVVSRGFCWSTTNTSPTLNGSDCYTVLSGSGDGVFSGHISKDHIPLIDYNEIYFYVRPFTRVQRTSGITFDKYGTVTSVHFQIGS